MQYTKQHDGSDCMEAANPGVRSSHSNVLSEIRFAFQSIHVLAASLTHPEPRQGSVHCCSDVRHCLERVRRGEKINDLGTASWLQSITGPKLSSGKDVAHCALMPFGHVDRGKGSGASTNVAVAFVVKASRWYLHGKDH